MPELVLSQLVSLIGDRVATLAFVSLAASAAIHNAGAAAANVGAVEVAPIIVVSYFGGWLSDRISRRTLMLLIDMARATIVVAIGVGLLHLSTPAAILGAAGALGLLSAIFNPAKRSFVPFLVPQHLLAAANWWMVTTEILAMMLGIGLGTLLLTVATPSTGMLVDALTFAAAIAILARMPRGLDSSPVAPSPVISPPVPSPGDASDTRALIAVFAGLIIPFFLTAGLFYAAANHWAAEQAPANAGAALGRLLLLLSAGALASIALRRPVERLGEPAGTAAVLLAGGAVQLVLASRAHSGILVTGPLAAAVGVTVGLSYVRTQYLVHRVTSKRVMGRVMSVREVAGAGAFSVTVVVTGWLGGRFDAAAGWRAAGWVFIAGGAVALLLPRVLPPNRMECHE